MLKGTKHSEETKRKLSISHKGKHIPITVRQKMSSTHKYIGTGKWMKGKKHSSETIKKMKSIHKGNQYGLGSKRTKEQRLKYSIAKKGANNPGWKGGISYQNIRNSNELKLWRKAVFERDNYTCVWCGKKGGELNADHIKPFCDYPELRFAIDNGRTLCINCHKKTDTYLWKARWKKC